MVLPVIYATFVEYLGVRMVQAPMVNRPAVVSGFGAEGGITVDLQPYLKLPWLLSNRGPPDETRCSSPIGQPCFCHSAGKLAHSSANQDGLRIDAAKHIAPAELAAILDKVEAPFVFLEVIGAQGQVVQPGQYQQLAQVTDFKYGTDIAQKFRGDFGGSLSQLRTLGDHWGLVPSDKAIVFIDNYDRERGHGGGGNLNYKDGSRYNLANVFMLADPQGYPKVMSGYQFTDGDAGPPGGGGCANNAWVCQHRWGNIANMVDYRRHTVAACLREGDSRVDHWWTNGHHQIAFGGADKGFVVINNQSDPLVQRSKTGLAAGDYCNILLFTDDPCGGEIIQVDEDGFASFSLDGVRAAAIHGGARPDSESEEEDFTKTFPSLFFRGTLNDWGALPMRLVADHTWEAEIIFDGRDGQRWKIDVASDWTHNYGDNDADGTLDRTGRDIFTDVTGCYRIQIRDDTLRYQLIRIEDTDGGGGGTVVDTLGAVYTPEAPPSLSGLRIMEMFGSGSTIGPIHGWSPRPPLAEREDAIIYELHVRDFTIDESAGVAPAKRGKYLGLVQGGATHDGVKTGLDHLLELGITHVQLMPVYDIASCPNLTDTACYN